MLIREIVSGVAGGAGGAGDAGAGAGAGAGASASAGGAGAVVSSDELALRCARRMAASGRPWFWLDGAGAPTGERRVSRIGLASEVREARGAVGAGGIASAGGVAGAGGAGTLRGDDARGFLKELRGGDWVLALGYEFGLALLDAPGVHDASAPRASASPARSASAAASLGFALRSDVTILIDHDSGSASLCGPDAAAIDAWLAENGGLLAGLGDPPSEGGARHPSASPAFSATTPRAGASTGSTTSPITPERAHHPRWRMPDAAYAEAVERCRAAIAEGEAYVLCLTDTAEVSVAQGHGFDPLAIYERLRVGAPTRGGVIVTGDRALVSASPERFLSVRARRVETHPIKGTRRRGASPDSDRASAAALGADPKERAENLMIVDLMRNDLSRVCEPGSVRVEGFLRVESHAHVHQLVSTVSGTLAEGRDVWDVIAAAFPGGSMTGAPKRRAVELLAELEAGPRGLYSGCFGWVDGNGDGELAMTIRGIELTGSCPDISAGSAFASEPRTRPDSAPERRFTRALVGAGGGVTIDSDPAREVAEKHVKAAALLAALRG